MNSEVQDMWINPKIKKEDKSNYLAWFDDSNNYKENYSKGYIDFFNRILTMDLYEPLGDPRKKTCLEIGFGGGRLLNAASKIFKHGYGVDVLKDEYIEITKSFLNENGSNNVTLFNRRDIDNIEDKSIDFVYSFIVFQHFDNWNEVEFYLDHIDRVITDTGVGIIYFARNDHNMDDYYCIENPPPQGISLSVNPKFAENQLSNYFEVLEIGEVSKQPWNSDQSAQFYIKFVR